MERLTVRSFDGSAHAKCVAYYDIIDKLAEYEDLEEQIMKKFAGFIDIKTILDSFCAFYDMQETNEELAQCTLLTNEEVLKYRQWKEAEEQGLLLRLPCKIGRKVFYVQKCLAPSCKECKGFLRVDNCYCQYKARIFEQEFDYRHLKAFGKSVFLTKEEAEQALVEMEKGNSK